MGREESHRQKAESKADEEEVRGRKGEEGLFQCGKEGAEVPLWHEREGNRTGKGNKKIKLETRV